MKTTTQNFSRALSRPELVGTEKRSQIDFNRRHANQLLKTEKLVALLRAEAPRFYELAEVVGQWVWITFAEKQPAQVTRQLAQFGFHWNGRRQSWQHPCGEITRRTQRDPRRKYGSYFAADAKS